MSTEDHENDLPECYREQVARMIEDALKAYQIRLGAALYAAEIRANYSNYDNQLEILRDAISTEFDEDNR